MQVSFQILSLPLLIHSFLLIEVQYSCVEFLYCWLWLIKKTIEMSQDQRYLYALLYFTYIKVVHVYVRLCVECCTKVLRVLPLMMWWCMICIMSICMMYDMYDVWNVWCMICMMYDTWWYDRYDVWYVWCMTYDIWYIWYLWCIWFMC